LAIERPNRRLTTILAADAVGYSRLVGTDEEGTLKHLRALRKDLIDPMIAAHRGRMVKTTGDGFLVEYASVVDAVRSAVEMQRAMADSNAGLAPDKRIEFRVGINLGDVVVEDDGDLMGDGVNVAARLEGIAEPGGICLSGAAYDQVRGKIDIAAQDRGEQHLKNIAEPVRIYALSPVHPVVAASHTAVAPRLSIVVLPFVNLGGNSEQDYFVDGITESLTTDLSRIPGAFVIARNTAFTFKNKPVDARVIGRELGVRYVMEGSVQSSGSGDRIRVTAQLIDTETGAHLWAERFDKPRGDAGFIKVLLGRAEEAEADLINAIRLSPRDPGLDRWHALLGIADLFLGRLESALDRLRKSVEINPNVAIPHFFLAAASALSGHAAEAREARNAGLRLDPNFTVARFRNERRSENPTFLAQRERIYEGLSLAGVPEGQ
jgi:class 3 adenylate cyclase/TolB-like protein